MLCTCLFQVVHQRRRDSVSGAIPVEHHQRPQHQMQAERNDSRVQQLFAYYPPAAPAWYGQRQYGRVYRDRYSNVRDNYRPTNVVVPVYHDQSEDVNSQQRTLQPTTTGDGNVYATDESYCFRYGHVELR